MSFNNSTQQEMMSEINVTPLVDVMLVLLVVFIITAPLLAPQSLKITLPRTTTVASDNKPLPLRLTVDAQGTATLDGQAMDDTALAAALQRHAPDAQVQLEADQAVPYGRVAALMAVAQKAGVSKLSFLTLAAH